MVGDTLQFLSVSNFTVGGISDAVKFLCTD